MDKNMKIVGIGLIVIVLLVGAYYLGTSSKNPTIPLENTQDTQTPHVTQEQSIIKQSAPEETAKTETPKPVQNNIITNSSACLTIANEAVKNNSMQDTKVVQAHFKQSTNNCYYEIQYPLNGDIMTSIHYAPNDQTIATCANTSGVCYQSDSGYINESTFHLIEAQYLTN